MEQTITIFNCENICGSIENLQNIIDKEISNLDNISTAGAGDIPIAQRIIKKI